MKLVRTLQIHPVLFGLVPMLNVLFLVAIFFTMSSRFILQPGMAVSLPASSFTLAPRDDSQIVSIISAPVPAIYHQEQRVTLEELHTRLSENAPKSHTLILKADKGTPYQLIMDITNDALKLGLSVVLATSSER